MAIVKKYKAEVVNIENPLSDIYTVSFKSENGKFKYNPGQFLHLTLEDYDPSLPWPESRCFSIQSSPSEELLKITFSVKGNFSKKMAEEIILRKETWLKLPYGDIFNRGHSTENCVFIAGGTGVTPFLSLFNDPSFKNYCNPKLYLGLREEKYNIFGGELNNVSKYNKNFKYSPIFQNVSGNLNIESIYNENPEATFFISGPPVMIKTFRLFLQEKKIEGFRIIMDDWE